MSVIETAYCTQQTAGLARGITLRAIHAVNANCGGAETVCDLPIRHHDIACNTLPCSFTWKGLLTHGKLYLNHTKYWTTEWRKNEAANISRADKNWLAVRATPEPEK